LYLPPSTAVDSNGITATKPDKDLNSADMISGKTCADQRFSIRLSDLRAASGMPGRAQRT
jgi:hypothetical protein